MRKTTNYSGDVQKRRKGSAAYQEAQAAAAEVAHSSADEQVQWLWDSYKNAVGESFLEQEALTGIHCQKAKHIEGILQKAARLCLIPALTAHLHCASSIVPMRTVSTICGLAEEA